MGCVIRWKLKATLLALMLGATGWVSAEEWLDAEILSADQLSDSSGRQGISMQWQVNDNQQNANVSDNLLSGTVVTGDNHISDNAFGNMSGVATVIQNTGNQVVIQDSTQINILINH
ncbi:hypothetical protein [Marinobacter halophilus]|uniref:hypothetical protein n=1 Tax=Marinobacter halophilus TaxID=1323740 RepID=UPI00198B64EF|nr:hypothetical protein [Marinobacter halophilus]GGC63029.1 hypothetical protein GCM10011362_09280 [Marinobacter halophilus]